MFTRRQFLEDSILAATAALAGPALAAPGTSHAAKGASANDRLAVAVIRAGIRGPVHARSFAGRGDCDVVAVCDADLGRARRLADAMAKQQGREVPACQDFGRSSTTARSTACRSPRATTGTPWRPSGRCRRARTCIVEKPVGHNLSEPRRLVQAARKHGRICQVGTQYRSDGTCQAAARFMAKGGLGKITLARSITYKRRRSIGPVVDGRVPDGVDYNLWAGPAPMSPITRRNFRVSVNLAEDSSVSMCRPRHCSRYTPLCRPKVTQFAPGNGRAQNKEPIP